MSLDPVCGRSVHPKQSEWLLVREGEAYHFCSATCRNAFSGQAAAARVNAAAPRLIQTFVITTQRAADVLPTPREEIGHTTHEVALAA